MEKIYISKYTGQEVDSILDLIKNRSFLSRVSEDETNYLIKFLSGLHVGYFLKGSNGIGMYQDENNKWHIEADYLDARLNPSTPGDTSFSELFEKVQLANGTWAIRAKFGLYSDSFISAKGANTNGGSTPGGGASALYQLNDVAKNSSADGVLGAAKGSLLSYDGTHWYAIPQSSVMPNLSGYATQSWVEDKGYATQLWVEGKGYSTKSELSTAISALNTELIGKIDLKLDAATFNELFEKVKIDDNTYAIRAKLGLFSDGFISAKGSNVGGTSSEGGAVALYQLNDVVADGTQVSGATDGAVFVYDGKLGKWKGVAQSEIVPNLTGYATEQWVLGKGYATTTDLDARIDALVNGAPQAYDTLKEIADVLAGNVNSISDILTALGTKADKATTLSGYGITDAYTIAQIDSIVNGLSGNISTLQGYFTDGVANSALRLSDNGSYTAWGQTFFTNGKPKSVSGALTDVTDITSSGTITTNKIVIGNGTIEWDEANKGFKVTGLYSTTYLSAKGANTNGGTTPSGNQYTRLDTWDGYTSAMDVWVLSAKLGKGLYDTQNSLITRVGALEGKATNVSFTQSLTSGTQIGSISIDGVTKNIYAPTIPTNLSQFTDDVVSGKYLPLSGGTIGANSSNPTNLVINSNNGIETAIQVSNNNVVKSVFGWWNGTGSYGTYIYNVASQKYLGIKDNGTPHYHGNTLIHEGNYTDYTYSKSTIDTKFGGYLPLSGGTIISNDYGELAIQVNNNGYASAIRYANNLDGTLGYIGIGGSKSGVGVSPIFINANKDVYPLIHSGNIGSQSVAYATSAGDADTLDGMQGSLYKRLKGAENLGASADNLVDLNTTTGFNTYSSTTNASAYISNKPYTNNRGFQMEVMCQLGSSANYVRQMLYAYGTNNIYTRYSNDKGVGWSSWERFAYLTSNVASATKLQTARSIWGQSFDGTGDVSGVLTLNYHSTTRATGIEVISTNGGEASIGFNLNSSTRAVVGCFANALNLWREDCGTCMTIPQSGNVLIGTTTDSGYKLDVVSASGGVLRLKSNDTYSGVRLEQGNGYAWFIGSDNTQELYMYYNGAHRFNLNATGNLKLGGSLWLNHGDYIANRATLVLNSNSNAADIIFKNNSTTKGDFGCWAISSRSESNYRFTIWRGGENATNAIEQELFTILANGNFGFANNNPQYRVDVNGVIHSTTGIFSDGYVSAKGQNTSSDMRLKNVLNEVVLGVRDIANAPSMRFAWKNGGGVDVGSSAQYWKGLLPDAVKERDGMLEMQYANIALLSAIAIAKNVETHEERIARLEKENEELRNEINSLKYGK